MRGVSPPRLAIQRRTSDGYMEYSIWVASGLVTARPLAPKSQAAWKPRLAGEVTQILSWGTAPRTMVLRPGSRSGTSVRRRDGCVRRPAPHDCPSLAPLCLAVKRFDIDLRAGHPLAQRARRADSVRPVIIPRRTFSVVCLAVVLVASGCSDSDSAGSPDSSGNAAEAPTDTTIDVTVDSQPVDLGDAALKCYDFEGHLMVEAFKKGDQDATHFLMDYYKDEVALSIGIKGAQPDLYEYTPGKPQQSATVRHDDHSVSVTGMIG